MTLRPLAATLALLFAANACASADWTLVNVVETPANTADALRLKAGVAPSANLNRFGFYSDLAYHPGTGDWYALADRGPGGGLIDYATRVERIGVPFDPATGVIGQPVIKQTALFKGANGQVLNGLNPLLLNGDRTQLGASFDPEGLALGRDGFFVADEYGPSIYEFSATGRFLRALTMPANLRPREAGGISNYVDGRPIVVNGRQDNRGFEGLSFNASRTKLYAVMQDPLVDEGSSNDGRRSRNVRIVEFNPKTGLSTAQYVYQLESRSVINAITPNDTSDDFSATNQGRSIGLSGITALSDSEFLVIERDNRGLGVEVVPPPLHKRIYRINLQGATDVSNISLAGSDSLPPGVTPVQKAAEVDILAALKAQGLTVPEKIEGIAIGPRLADGRHLVLLGTDNDFSVTQSGVGEQFEVCVNRNDGSRAQVPLDAPCPEGKALIPGMLMGFAVDFSSQ